MAYDFDRVTERRGTGSLKWDVEEDVLPMWVADMDFQTAPEVMDALSKRAGSGVFGYSIVTDEWYRAYQLWWGSRHGLTVEKDWLIFSTGVIPIISSAVRKLTTPAEKVLLQTPVYNTFYNCILNNGRNVIESPLAYEDRKPVLQEDAVGGEPGLGEAFRYSMDLDDLERKLADPQTAMMILCNPHNPTGNIWDRETLARVGELCKKHQVTVLADEIHCDLTAPGKEYIPFASVSETCREISITAAAPTKAFNLAGIQTAAAIVPDKKLRHKLWRALNTDEVAEPNAFAVDAAVAAFTKGGQWLEELRVYIQDNKEYVKEYLEREVPGLVCGPLDATYLLWLNSSSITEDSHRLAAHLRRKARVYLTPGKVYGGNGDQFLRLNVACPRSVLEEGLARIKQGVESFSR